MKECAAPLRRRRDFYPALLARGPRQPFPDCSDVCLAAEIRVQRRAAEHSGDET